LPSCGNGLDSIDKCSFFPSVGERVDPEASIGPTDAIPDVNFLPNLAEKAPRGERGTRNLSLTTQPYVTGRTTIKPPPAQGERKEEPPSEGEIDRETFFTKFECKKPSDNVFLIAAYDYSQFGTAGISSNEVRKLADEVGITVPRRPDATLAQAKRNGKSLFDRTGSGRYKPTVYGEKFFRETYEVSKGTKKKPDVEA